MAGTLRSGPAAAGEAPVRLWAPAKLTCSLRVGRRRDDGLHELRAEMASLSLADELVLDPGATGLSVQEVDGIDPGTAPEGADNLVARALGAVGGGPASIWSSGSPWVADSGVVPAMPAPSYAGPAVTTLPWRSASAATSRSACGAAGRWSAGWASG